MNKLRTNTILSVGTLMVLTLFAVGCTTSTSNTDAATTKYTTTEVTQHDNANDCWMIIEGSVYDVTDFISSHPGGTKILQGCGIDATTLFKNQDGGGFTHSLVAREQLKAFQIGELQ